MAQVIRYIALPKVFPVLLSITICTFECKVRTGTILKRNGAGGIGLLLPDRIQAR